jgi:uncharacterized cupin superfamily protein
MKLPAIDPKTITPMIGISRYAEKYRGPVAGRERRILGDACGIKSFGVNLTIVPPGQWSSQRHWHSREDEFIFIVEGELVLVTDAGEQVLRAGQGAGFPANSGDGHHFINRTDKPATILEVGGRDPKDEVDYSDVDMMVRPTPDGRKFTDKKGNPF